MTLPQYKRTASTRDRLLYVACGIFSEKGYRDTTVAEICEAAQANIAAVNYHFGNKDSLYQQVWAHVLDVHVPLEPDPERLATRDGAVEQFFDYVVDRLEWLMRGDRLERLLRAEIVQPTGLVDDQREAAMQKTRQHFLDVINKIAESTLSADGIQLCCTSVLSQCRAFMALAELDHSAEANFEMPEEEIRAYARHVTTFSVAGIKALAAHETAAGAS